MGLLRPYMALQSLTVLTVHIGPYGLNTANEKIYAEFVLILGEKLIANIPDGSLSRSGSHDAVLVIDPFPKKSFGHFLFGFFVDQLDETTCELSGGTFIRKYFFVIVVFW